VETLPMMTMLCTWCSVCPFKIHPRY